MSDVIKDALGHEWEMNADCISGDGMRQGLGSFACLKCSMIRQVIGYGLVGTNVSMKDGLPSPDYLAIEYFFNGHGRTPSVPINALIVPPYSCNDFKLAMLLS